MYGLLKGTFKTPLDVGEKSQRLDGTNLDTVYTMPQYEHNDTYKLFLTFSIKHIKQPDTANLHNCV